MGRIHYEITIDGGVPPEVLEELHDVQATALPVTTMLTGPVLDQSDLHGVLNRLHGAGLVLIAVRRLSTTDPRSASASASTPTGTSETP